MTDDVALLVERALGGDPGAADRLVRLHMGAAYAVALAVTRNPHEAEDVAQDALVLALERLAECRDLPQTQREVLLLHDLEGWKHREIGESLGMPEGTVRYHLFNARRAVRGRLRALVGEED
jgi:DNA-directed RNA polymerase specialized sigma24 family protein